ncbi:hypothetical protein FOZ63_003921, partial [Perkinsus olseni]
MVDNRRQYVLHAAAVHALQLIAGSRGRSRSPVDDVPRVALLTRRGSCHFGPDITYAKLFQAAEEGAFAFDLSENVGTPFIEADLLGNIISTLTFDRSPRECVMSAIDALRIISGTCCEGLAHDGYPSCQSGLQRAL